MRTRSAWTVIGLAAAVPVILIWCQVGSPPANQITEEAAKSIRPGMTRDQVERLLGPERDETHGRAFALLPPSSRFNPRTLDDRQWLSKRAAITVGFDRETGRAVDVWLEKSVLWDPSLWDRIEEWVQGKLARGKETE